MGRKIFVSYKYADDDVEFMVRSYPRRTTVRDYVNEIEDRLGTTSHIFKGEHDGEDLSALSDGAIWESLKDKIYDSSLAIVMISPGMRDGSKPDRDQWIPWEISYSLKETSRRDSEGNPVTSRTNAMLAVVLPDSSGSYDYYLHSLPCCPKACTEHRTGTLFGILRRNKFNRVDAETVPCSNDGYWVGDVSYIKAVRWSDFIADMDRHIGDAYKRRDDIGSFMISKSVEI
ncbi:TIR domain-containing protein [Collinsella ihumii]|uniref:TIR domain-containing protein n=1 Tax=Collinsella ihumii TaxID=1720204 RepID=UPI00082A340B|nr:TIR domain-containing protein [Collinsella ihumii]